MDARLAALLAEEQLESVDDPINTHFICCSCVDGHLYDLDSQSEEGPNQPRTLEPGNCLPGSSKGVFILV